VAETDAGVDIGKILDQIDDVQGRVFKDWRDKIGGVRSWFVDKAENARRTGDTALASQADQQAQILHTVYTGMDHATRSWTKTKEEIEGRKAYTDLQNAIIKGWPKRAVADRLFYLGAGFLGSGGVAYAILGPEATLGYAFLWAVGLGALVVSLIFLHTYDKERATYFAEIRNRVR